MSETFVIEEASRQGVKELIGLFGMSSGGKTRSGLVLARGIVGPSGRIVVIDTENRRASYFADLPAGPACPGKFKVINLDEPFSPERYKLALKATEKEADIVVIDSMTHEWSGAGGVLALHEEALDRMTHNSTDWKERERLNWPAWREPKMEHKAFIMYLLRYPLPLICCLRGKSLTKMVKENGRNTVITEPHPVPDFDDKFIFEMLLAGEVYRDNDANKSGLLRITKVSRDEIVDCLPKHGEQICVKHGEALHRWCAGQSLAKKPDDRSGLLSELRKLTQPIHNWDGKRETWATAKGVMQQWLADECAVDVSLDALAAEELASVISRAKEKLHGTPATA